MTRSIYLVSRHLRRTWGLPSQSQKKCIKTFNAEPIINDRFSELLPGRKIMFYCISHPAAVRFRAHIASLGLNSEFDRPDGVGGCRDEAGVLGREHRQVVEMVADGENIRRGQFQAAGEFAQGGPFVVA